MDESDQLDENASAFRLVGASGQILTDGNGVWECEEATTLWVIGADEVWAEGVQLPTEGHRRCRLDLPFAVGELRLRGEIRGKRGGGQGEGVAGQTVSARLRVRPAGIKLEPAEWAALIEDLERWLGDGASLGAEGPKAGRVAESDKEAQVWALPLIIEALLGLIPGVEAAFARVVTEPCYRVEHRRMERPPRQVRRVDAGMVRELGRRPEVVGWTRGQGAAVLGGREPQISVHGERESLDHPANRHVVFLIRSVIRRLYSAASALATIGGRRDWLKDGGRWVNARAKLCNAAAERLQRCLRRSPFARLQGEPASEGAMLVVMDHPAYAQVQRLCRRLLSPFLRVERPANAVNPEHPGGKGLAEQDGLSAGTRASYTLYEVWCLFRLRDLLIEQIREVTGSMPMVITHNIEPLVGIGGTGRGAQLEVNGGTAGDPVRLRLWFNRTFRRLTALPLPAEGASISKERRPDICMTVEAGGATHWVVFDAKYRSGLEGLGDAMESAHIYRDSLQWPSFGGAPRSAFLLCPRANAQTGLWFSSAYCREFRMGAWELRPGLAPSQTLKMQVQDALGMERWRKEERERPATASADSGPVGGGGAGGHRGADG